MEPTTTNNNQASGAEQASTPIGPAVATPAPDMPLAAIQQVAQAAAATAVQQFAASAGAAAPPPLEAPSPVASQTGMAFHAMARAQTALRNLQPYDGTRDYLVVNAWIFKCEQAMAMREKEYKVLYEDDFKVLAASCELTSDAATWWYGQMQENKAATTWAAFKDQVRVEFIPTDYVRRAWEKLNRTHQAGSVESYIALFRRRALAVPNLSSAEKWNAFVLGLKPALEMRVREANVMTFEGAAETALRYESAWASAGITPEQAIGSGLPSRAIQGSRGANRGGGGGGNRMEISNVTAAAGSAQGGGRDNSARARPSRRKNYGLSAAELQARRDRNACFACNQEGCRPHYKDCAARGDGDKAGMDNMQAAEQAENAVDLSAQEAENA